MSTNFNIILIGPSGCGKSSFIASLIHSLREQKIVQLQSSDATSAAERLMYANRMHDMFTKGNIAYNDWEDDGRSDSRYITSHDFDFNVGIDIHLHLTDVPGKILDENVAELTELIQQSHVIFVAIDTPVLMEGGFSKVTRNNVQTITDLLLSSLSTVATENIIKQQIQFVPLKCEKYYQPSSSITIKDVNATIKDVYSEVIDYVHTQDHLKALITPAQTVGDMVFDHFGEQKEAHYAFVPNAHYHPQQCEQPFLFALDFMLRQHKWETPEEATRARRAIYNVLDFINHL